MKSLLKKFVPYFALVSIITHYSCKRTLEITPIQPIEITDVETIPPVDIYISGQQRINNMDVACYWKNGDFFPVTDQTKASWAEDIVVNNGTVYLAGSFDNKPCFWENGVRTDLNPQLFRGFVHKMLINQDMLYFVGKGNTTDEDSTQAILWKKEKLNMPETILSNTIREWIEDLAFENNQLYIPGTFKGKPGYWINNWDTRVDIPGELGGTKEIIFHNGDTYIVGARILNNVFEWGYWKNNLFHSWNFGVEGAVFDSEINEKGMFYATGFKFDNSDNRKAHYWVDGTGKNLTTGGETSYGNGIAINSTDIYVAGHQEIGGIFVGGYWKNNEWVSLGTAFSAASDIYLVKK